jgi:hypothetical protein
VKSVRNRDAQFSPVYFICILMPKAVLITLYFFMEDSPSQIPPGRFISLGSIGLFGVSFITLLLVVIRNSKVRQRQGARGVGLMADDFLFAGDSSHASIKSNFNSENLPKTLGSAIGGLTSNARNLGDVQVLCAICLMSKNPEQEN